MNKEPSSYRHPKHDAIAAMLQVGATVKDTAATLGADRRAVARVRNILGMAPVRNSSTAEEKVARFSVPLDGGHTGWSGRVTTASQVPSIRHRSVEVPASHVAFEQRAGRPPVGIVKAECGVPHCLTPSHLSDVPERRNDRMNERALHGMKRQPWDVCPNGRHDWDRYGRVQSDLTSYCTGCSAERNADRRAAARAETTA